MAAIFQIRRGSGSVSLVDGELYVKKGPDTLQYAVGTREVTLTKLDEVNVGSLYLSGGISASGDITASNMYISGNVKIEGNLFLGNQTSDTITATGEFTSHLIPNPTDTYNLGSDSKRWGRMYVNSISASAFTGSLYGMGDPTSFSTSVDARLDYLEGPFSTSVDNRIDLLESAMSGSNRLYVSPQGTDTTGSVPHGTQQNPFKTIKAAVESLGSAIASNMKRYTIFVGSGNYTEQNPIAVPPGVAIVGDNLRTVRLTAANPKKDFFHVHDSTYFYGLRFLNLQYPSFAFSFPSSTATATISGDSISGLTFVHTEVGYVDGEGVNVIIEGSDVGGTTATATATVSGGVITLNMVESGSGYVVGEKPHVSIQSPDTKRPIITTSPYVQNCSSITGPFLTDGITRIVPVATGEPNTIVRSAPYDYSDVDEQGAGGGIRIDGNLVSSLSPLESFVADAFTQVNQGGPGHLIINKGYAQFVSCFTTFCTYGFKTSNGGFANISNSVIDFGNYGLISKTYFPTAYNTGSSLETKTSEVTGVRFSDKGAGYTGSTVPVQFLAGGFDVQATGYATINNDTSLADIVITNSGSGYTSRPTVQIDAPTAIGNRAAIVVDGSKADISGVTQMLIEIDGDTRGVDISSNMILNGINYLVTDVSAGNTSTQRRVTTYPAPPSISYGNVINFHQLSNISTGGLVMEYVGSGVTYNALPKFGGVPIRTREINEYAPGRVFYSTVDEIGNLKIGDFFSVNQLTGEVTITADTFNLSGLNAIGPFRRNGAAVGVVLQEVSNNTTLVNAQGLFGEDTVPTQYAVKEYIKVISASLDGRVDNLELTASNHEGRIDSLELYTSSLNVAIELTGSTVSFLGNIIVYGTQSVINSQNLTVTDNLIYLNASSSVTDVDLGWIGNYNDGTYAHAGFFRDASDTGTFKVFKGLTTESSGTIDTSHASFQLADFKAQNISSSTIVGLGNATLYSESVDFRLDNLETNAVSWNSKLINLEAFTSSQNIKDSTLATYTGSIDTKWNTLQTTTSSLNAFTLSIDTQVDSIQVTTSSLNDKNLTLATYTGSIDSKFIEIQSSTASLNIFTQSIDTKVTTIQSFTGSQESKNSTLATYTGSIDGKFIEIQSSTASLNIFTASAYISFSVMTASIEDHEDRISYIEGISGISGGNPLLPLNIFSASTNTRLTSLENATSSYETTGRGIISGSSQVITLLPTGVVSGSSQVLDGSGVASGSYETTGRNIVSGSSQITLSSTTGGSTISDVQFASLGIGTTASGVSGEIRASGDITAYYSSDERLKSNIQPIGDALTKVNQISGNTYDWMEGFENIHSHTGTDIGVIAQEIEKVLPQAVINRETGYKAVNYEKILPLLIQAIKELSAKVSELERK